ncbi:molybdenum cofactor biosynthesis protein MoaE [Pseudoalteromonas sp. KG3]|uniref:molybdenum cofactor biosynthesis protein MoaE n=1 Tax=Pseudoalteromonas TaxID=53246 RepID=UPI0021477389|nr:MULTISPECIES: molybdenum cofactor biosynthesis protein MoaE [Pseudoalteromonas]WKD25525.1 molybdenum cofactor biosynthesis protein MoaE [Pseudoalteromonas sp. KG3]
MIKVCTEDFDLGELTNQLRQKSPQSGAIVNFVGLVRDINHGQNVSKLFLEHYPAMTEKILADICSRAKTRFAVDHIDVIHRVGELGLNSQIVYVGVSAIHRGDAFSCCEYVMDYLKSEAPFWKKENQNGQQVWLDANPSDVAAKARWEQ